MARDYPVFEGDPSQVNDESTTTQEDAVPAEDTTSEETGTEPPAAEETVTEEPVEDTQPVETSEPAEEQPGETEESAPPPEEDSGNLAPELDGYRLDFATLGTKESGADLKGDAFVDADEPALALDGDGDWMDLNRLEAFEGKDQMTASVTFQRDNPDGDYERIAWNHQKLGISVKDDALYINLGSPDRKFYKAFKIEDAGLDDSESHSVSVAVDSQTDRAQVVLDGEVVFEDRETDFEIAGAGGREWGWWLSNPWDEFEGRISDFQLDDEAVFVDDASLMA